jgi:hypothetical protein
VVSSDSYFSEQLRRLNMDKSQAIQIWQKVLLFRRIFNDVGNAVFVDAFAYNKFQSYAQETAKLESYHLAPELRFVDYRDLQKFETYLSIVAPRDRDGVMTLGLPMEFLTVEDIEEDYPEMISRRYLLQYSKVNKASLQVRVGVKEAWDWQVEDGNWLKLSKEFPELGINADNSSAEERFSLLLQLDEVTRERVDTVARKAIVENHPEWVEEALDQASLEKEVIHISSQGGDFPFKGVVDRESFIELLNAAPLGKENKEGVHEDATQDLWAYSADKQNYYRIFVMDRDKDKDILTFAEANYSVVLDTILDNVLKERYSKLKRARNKSFNSEDGKMKPFEQVKNEVADIHFKEILEVAYNDYMENEGAEKGTIQMSGSVVAPRRFYFFLRALKSVLEESPDEAIKYIATKPEFTKEELLPVRKGLGEQWKLLKEELSIKRNIHGVYHGEDVFSLEDGQWSEVFAPAHGDVHFFNLLGKEKGQESVAERVQQGQQLLSNDARKILMDDILLEIKKNKAISFKHVRPVEEPLPEAEAS